MSVFLFAAMCAIAAAAAGFAVERRRPAPEPAPGDPPDPEATRRSPFADAGLAMDLGDVVSVDRAERWLSGALELRDGEHLVAALFVAPEGARHDAVCAFPSPRRDVLWLSPTTVEVGPEPPSSIELDGIVMHRRARVPVRVQRHGQGAPEVAEQVTFAEYEATSRAAGVILFGRGVALAWAGRRVEADELDRMGRGEA